MNELERGITEVIFFQYLLIHTLIFMDYIINSYLKTKREP